MSSLITTYLENNPFIFSSITENNIGTYFSTEQSGLVTGDIVCTTELYDELIKRFGSYEKAKTFYELAYTLINNGEYASYGVRDSVPYLDFNIYIEQETNDEGIMASAVEKWIPGKKYYIGDVVYYSETGLDEDIMCYKLVSGGTIDYDDGVSIPLYDIVQITSEEYDSYVEWNSDPKHEQKDIFISEYDGLHYLRLPYFNGYYDKKTKIVYFDTYENGQLVFNHWVKSVEEQDIPIVGKSISGITESMLSNIKRKKKDIDDTNETLPFIFHYNIVPVASGSSYTKRVLDRTCTELQYMAGFTNNEITTDDRLISDVTYCIEFFSDEEMKTSCGKFDLTQGAGGTMDVPITTNSLSDTPKVVTFTYYIGAEIKKDANNLYWELVSDTGVKYVETYYVSIQNYEVLIDEETFELPYFNIGNLYAKSNTNFNSDLQRNVSFSDVYYTENQVVKDCFFNVPTFREEATIGVQNRVDNINEKIERGKAISFEKHNALGEVCTLQDMEHYHNDFFKINNEQNNK